MCPGLLGGRLRGKDGKGEGMEKVSIFAETNGSVRCVYTEAIDLSALGTLHIDRASHVEFDNVLQCWLVTWTEASEMRRSDCAKFGSRAEALLWEEAQLIAAMATAHASKE